ncbi:MAG: tRNA uridine-5-carboxymethylaminomethyl(34) synthesis GTPase MnmE [Bacteroidetes bacterium]|nr:MAG: tRNA uridine-5-carboxymethylaminomethyl(34) synthesis GTPase MnmE [Bacteroidota bacterium]
MNHSNQDTICALATAPGSGAIAIIRLSGSAAFTITESLFYPAKKGLKLSEAEGHTAHFGILKQGDEIIDEVLVTIFKNPKSYTGEDSVEISCHGSVFIQQKIIELLLEKGARMAEPGEFSQRAFLNGKFDLSQAEAVADLIASESKTAHQIAMRQLRGTYSNRIKELRIELLNFASLIELELDFAEEDVEFANRSKFVELVNKISSEIEKLIHSFKVGNVLKDGIPVAIVGKPNVGKSTLLNALLNEEKAIVSDIPGTTRDVIEDKINLQGTLFRFIDTAGIRESDDTIESIGIERTYSQLEQASVVLFLIEAEPNLSLDGIKTQLKEAKIDFESGEQKIIVLINKIDQINIDKISGDDEVELISISAKNKIRLQEIEDALITYVQQFNIQSSSIVTNARHIEAFNKSLAALQQILFGFESGIPTDLISIDVRDALYHLGSITGEITNDELLGNIFGKFCIGK